MRKSHKTILKDLKKLNLNRLQVSLALLNEYKKDRMSRYTIRYVRIDENLEKRLKRIVTNRVEQSNTVEEYTFDCPEPEEDQIRAINYEETDFLQIFETLRELNPETDVINDVDELVRAKAYLIIFRNSSGIQVVAFKKLPENWKMKRSGGLIPLLFKENRFEDLETDNVFSIASTLDMVYFQETLFILSKKDFEQGLNFRDGMIAKAEVMYSEARDLNLFVDINILIAKVGNNQRYLRKIATINNLGHYRNPNFLQQFKKLNTQKGWNIQFNGNQIMFTDETIDTILTILQNKRLHSELTNEDFDVESAKPLN